MEKYKIILLLLQSSTLLALLQISKYFVFFAIECNLPSGVQNAKFKLLIVHGLLNNKHKQITYIFIRSILFFKLYTKYQYGIMKRAV